MNGAASIRKAAISVRCYAELNDYLPVSRRGREFELTIEPPVPMTVERIIRALGIPESEVDVVLRDGESVSFSTIVDPGRHLSLFPVFESFDISGVTKLRNGPLRNPRFILDVHLGKLASFMRMMGYDALYQPGYNDDELVSISMHEERALLSKDRALLTHRMLTRAYHVNAIHPRDQLIEVLARFHLTGLAAPFTRCIVCNTTLQTIPKDAAENRLPPRVSEAFHEFFYCGYCDRIYWKGSHYERMRKFIDAVRSEL
jgi:uncharacterized protein